MATTVSTTTATDVKQYSAITGGEVVADINVVSDYAPIVDKLMEEKFKLYNQHRQILRADIKRSVPLKPFTMFMNRKDGNKKFMSIGYSWNLCDDKYTIDLYEYDNETTINLIP